MLSRTRIGMAIGLLAPAMTWAAPFSPFEARGYAMGGAGVAASEHAAATLYNPALLALKTDSKRFSIIAPALGARAWGSENAVQNTKDFADSNSLDNFNNAANTYNTALQNYISSQSSANSTSLSNASSSLKTASDRVLADLQSVNNKTFQVGAGGTLAIALPRENYTAALNISSEFFGRATTDVTTNDLTLIGNTVNTVTNATSEILANSGALTGPQASQIINNATQTLKIGGDNAKPTSKVHVVGASVTDIGISYARAVELSEQSFLVGVTPKLQQVNTVAFDADVDTDTIKFNQNKKTATGFNVDVGIAKQFTEGRWQNVRAGLVVRNLIPHTYKTMVAGQDVKLSPQLRAGVAYATTYYTLTTDLDLTANKVVGTGSEDKSQYLSVGGELNAWNVAKLRLGYRNDLKAKYGAVTAGVSLFGVQLSAAYAQDRELAALLQFSAAF